MRIAQLAPPWISVPPAGYGGTERVVQQLCDGLTERGHEVVLYASGDSRTRAELRSIFPAQAPHAMGQTSYDARHVAFAFRDIAADRFDLVHDHSGFLGVAFGRCLPAPIVHTVHGAFNAETYPFYQQFAGAVSYVAISKAQRAMAPPGMKWAGVVYNGIETRDWPFSAEKDDYLFAFGRICKAKGFHLSIEAALRTGRKLVIAGVVQDAGREYFESQVRPYIDGEQIIYEGEVNEERWRRLFARARAFLFPITWAEPFGLVMIEALAAGTPVIALRRGSVEEVVEHGKTGFICDSLDDIVAAVARLDEINPHACRRAAEERFAVGRMVAAYEAVYRRVLTQAQPLHALESA